MVKRVEDEEVIRVLSRVMKIPKKKVNKDLKLGSIPEWDSLTHLNIYFEIQKVFKRKISTYYMDKYACLFIGRDIYILWVLLIR